MHWDHRQARYTLLLFLLVFTAGQVKAYLTRPIYPDPVPLPENWPPEGHLVDATVLKGRALEVFPSNTTVWEAVKGMKLAVDRLGSGFCLPRAGVLTRGAGGWRIRPMTQRERWVWRIPMDLYHCTPEDLELISGIGSALAEKIHRFVQERGALASVSDLDDVSGVGKGKLEVLMEELEIP